LTVPVRIISYQGLYHTKDYIIPRIIQLMNTIVSAQAIPPAVSFTSSTDMLITRVLFYTSSTDLMITSLMILATIKAT